MTIRNFKVVTPFVNTVKFEKGDILEIGRISIAPAKATLYSVNGMRVSEEYENVLQNTYLLKNCVEIESIKIPPHGYRSLNNNDLIGMLRGREFSKEETIEIWSFINRYLPSEKENIFAPEILNILNININDLRLSKFQFSSSNTMHYSLTTKFDNQDENEIKLNMDQYKKLNKFKVKLEDK